MFVCFWMFDTLIFVCFSMYICVVLHILLIAVFYLSSVCVHDSPVHNISLMFIIHNRLFSYTLFRLLFKFFFSFAVYLYLPFFSFCYKKQSTETTDDLKIFLLLILDLDYLVINYANEFYTEISIPLT